jgi:hypothetical protein
MEMITLDPSYIAAVKKATREWEDKTAETAGDWFKKMLAHKRAFEERWNGAKIYRMEFQN